MSGHWNMGEYATAVRAALADVTGNSRTWQDYWRSAVREGIVGESALAGELRDTLKDFTRKDWDVAEAGAYGMAHFIKKVAIRAPERIYRLSDEIGKIVGWENEKALQRQIHPEWTGEQVSHAAAQRVRDTYPTYSMVSETLKKTRQQPVVGPFMTFAAETYRTSYNAMRYAIQEARSANPVERRIGIRRLASITATLGSGVALSYMTKALFGTTQENEDDLRRFMPAWSHNSQLAYLGPIENGKVRFVNFSYQNPYSTLVDPFIALFARDPKEFDRKFIEAVTEFVRPFTSEQMLASAVVNVARNKTKDGRPIYSEVDSDQDKVLKSVRHLLTAIEPGTMYRARAKIIPAFKGKGDYNRQLSPTVELGAELTGIRAEQVDVGAQIGFSMRKFAESNRAATQMFSSQIGKTASVSDAQLVESYVKSEHARYRLWSEIGDDIAAARRLGVSRQAIVKQWKAANLPATDLAFIMAGKYVPSNITESMMEKARTFGRKMPVKELNAARRALKFGRAEPMSSGGQ